jgi:hypothetical protein
MFVSISLHFEYWYLSKNAGPIYSEVFLNLGVRSRVCFTSFLSSFVYRPGYCNGLSVKGPHDTYLALKNYWYVLVL